MSDDRQRPLAGLVASRYKILRKIGSGSFGDIYLGEDKENSDVVAIKFEHRKAKHPQLEYEARVLRHLAGGVGLPKVYHFGICGDYDAMVFDLLGPSLEDLFNYCHRKLSLKTVLLLADQLLTRIEFIHSREILHRDIKPDNFLMGTGRRGNMVHIIDFGLAKRYRHPRSHVHIAYRSGKSLTGTPRYASIHTHLGREQSRRDDLEALGYMLMYFLRGSLPWMGIQAVTKEEKYKKILDLKMRTPPQILTQGFPNEFCQFFEYCRQLEFEAEPDYSYLRKILRDLFARSGYVYDYIFDWTISPSTSTATKSQDDQSRQRHVPVTDGIANNVTNWNRPSSSQQPDNFKDQHVNVFTRIQDPSYGRSTNGPHNRSFVQTPASREPFTKS